MSDYEQVSGTTVDVGLDNFEYEQRTGTTVDIELQFGPPYTITVNGNDVTSIEYNGEVKQV